MLLRTHFHTVVSECSYASFHVATNSPGKSTDAPSQLQLACEQMGALCVSREQAEVVVQKGMVKSMISTIETSLDKLKDEDELEDILKAATFTLSEALKASAVKNLNVADELVANEMQGLKLIVKAMKENPRMTGFIKQSIELLQLVSITH